MTWVYHDRSSSHVRKWALINSPAIAVSIADDELAVLSESVTVVATSAS